MDLIKFLEGIPYNKKIMESFVITYDKMVKYENIMCSVSGGSDSDIVIDLCSKLDEDKKITYVFFDTGLEYEATKEHLKYIEETYQIQIHRIKGKKTVPLCCNTYGQPFLSKQVSEWIERLQRHNFQWENEPLEILLNRYPGCRAALRWWCNDFANREDGRISSYNIGYNKYLKEFMVQHPPEFRISNKCCHFAKKNVALRFKKEGKFDLSIVGVRKAEGGARSTAYTSCFSAGEICDEYRPIFWYLKATKKEYEEYFRIKNSRCYDEYGLKRTGCVGCPFGRNLMQELETIRIYEPRLYVAVNNIFGNSYAYTEAYRDFVNEQRRLERERVND